jgi:hypothetical protein
MLDFDSIVCYHTKVTVKVRLDMIASTGAKFVKITRLHANKIGGSGE